MPIKSDADVIRALLNGHWSPYVPYAPSAKQLAFCALPHMEALGGGAAGGGKVLPEYGHVLTPNGFVSNSDLCVGMQVNHPDWDYSEITHLHEWDEYPLWRVHFHDGSFSDVTSGHLWFAWKSGIGVKKQGKRVFGKKAGKVIDTATLEQWLIKAKTQMDTGKRPNWPCIPVCGPQEFSELRKYKSPISPYLLGMWLGDGNWSDCPCSAVCITSGDHGHMEIALSNESYTRNGKFGYRFVAESGLIWKNELTRLNLKGTKANTKFVPKEFLTANLQTRLSLLQGLMDTDGTVDDRGQCYFTSVSEQLIDDVTFLVQSLGGTATKSRKTPYYRGKSGESCPGQVAYTLYIKAPEGINLFRLERKSTRLAQGNPSQMYRRVVSIEKKGTFKGRCISVSHPNGLYITDQFVVTHNSAVLLMDALRYTDVPGYAAIIFRRSLTDLKRNGGLLDMAMQWLGPFIGRDLIYEPSTHMFKWFNGASLTFGYVGSYTAWEHYQGGNYQYIAWDELTQHSEQDYDEMFSRLRRNSCAIHGDFPQKGCPNCDLYGQLRSVPLRVRGATNPGGRGHLWVKKRFKLRKVKDPKLINPVTKEPGIWVSGDPSKPFIPWFFVDNPGLDQETYDQTLRMIRDDQRKAQLLEGDWDWIANGVFRPEWFAQRWEYVNGYYAMLSPTTGVRTHSYHEKDLRIYITVDVACSVREGVGERSFKQTQGGQLPASWTVMGVFGVTPKGELLVLDMVRFQQEAPGIFDALRDLTRKWRPMYVALEVNGPGKPIAQQALQYGIPLKEVVSYVDKPSNSVEAQLRCRQGKVFLPREDTTTWQNDFLGELTTWTGHPHEPDDQVDVLSNAVHEFTRLCGNPDRDTTLKSHARDLPFVSKKHGKIFDYPSATDLMPW